MIEAGCAKKLIFSWAGNPGVGSLHALRRRFEATSLLEPRLELEEYSHFGLLSRFLAASAGLPFWPLDNYQGADIGPKNPNIKSVTCPYSGKDIATVPALCPDVAVVHCQRADRLGNAQVWGLYGAQKEVAFAAKKVIVVAEEIVPTETIRRDPNRTLVPSIITTQVVHEPWGAHPSYVQGHYDRDNDFYVQWEDISRDPATYKNYLDAFVYGCKDRADYSKKLGDGVLQKLKAKPRRCEGVDYGY
jgi:glutaconate CoA-transferase subunit A